MLCNIIFLIFNLQTEYECDKINHRTKFCHAPFFLETVFNCSAYEHEITQDSLESSLIDRKPMLKNAQITK